ncbi:nucleoside/nucleotide kinase family protein [Streptomyces sp. NPDC088757]|uniref:nucleoside/nucleotide kinase family protein n=1 Tax=Streptomyces sp. NPDC088757 TaxID=3365889 RepID=UPI003829AC43
MDTQQFERLAAHARTLAEPGPEGARRRILGLAGPPGAGKSTLAARLVDGLGGLAVLVPMDGFHLARAELVRLGRADRKGAPDTFDAAGYTALLARLHTPELGTTVYAPAFDRSLEEPVAGSVPVGPDVPLVVTEGNYLLHDEGAWAGVLPLLDEAWYLDLDARLRVPRLIDRHVRFGKDRARAELWVNAANAVSAFLGVSLLRGSSRQWYGWDSARVSRLAGVDVAPRNAPLGAMASRLTHIW